MRRRDFIALAGASGAAMAMPRVALAQAKVPRIAFMWAPLELQVAKQAFLQGLSDYGYVDGKNVTLDFYDPPTFAEYPVLVAKIVVTRPDVIVTHGTAGATAAKAATTTIPIVFGGVSDPVASGLVASLAHPGGNATGTSIVGPDLVGKQLGIMKEVVPGLRRVASLNDPNVTALVSEQVRAAAALLDLEPLIVDVVNGPDFVTQFDRVVAASPQAVYVPPDTYYSANSDLLCDLQIRDRLPLLAGNVAGFPRALIGYGPNNRVQERKTGAYIDAILKGAKPADLPVEQPTAFEFVINLTTAKVIGITVPASILAQATQVIQ